MTTTTVLIHKETGFTLNTADMKPTEIVEALKEAGHTIGVTSLRNLLKGNVTNACGFEMALEDNSTEGQETPEVVQVADETEEAALAVAEPEIDPEVKPVEAKPVSKRAEKKAKVKEVEEESNEPAEPVYDEVVNIPTFLDTAKRGGVFGWISYECKDTALAAKTARMARKLGRIAASEKLADEQMTVGLINRDGNDMIMIYNPDMTVAYIVTPKKRYEDGAEASVETADDSKVNGSWKDVVAFFMS